GQTGLFTTVTLVVSAVGGAFAGVVADRTGHVSPATRPDAMMKIIRPRHVVNPRAEPAAH
ncbi:hypothetical protein AB8A21_21715, partial [Streptomyces sp. BF23-18]|uniref:hypothetical protein n=1 Tax=Streptomyces sp. BF23-18 TaxID=3240282 RepID=UPI0034E5A567